MKKYINILFIAALLGFSACNDDFLTIQPTQSQEAGGDATEGAIMANLAATYQILLFDSYADYNFNSIVLMSDLRSDDIYKGGGDAGDQAMLYRLSQLDATPTELPVGLWNIYYSGIARANNAVIACENAVGVSDARLAALKSEALFLRAYYTHWLWKFWGNIPYFTGDLPEPYMAPQYTASEIYNFIMADLNAVIETAALPMRTEAGNDGRVTLAAAYMLKARVVMYQKDESRYAEVLKDMNEILKSEKYKLVDFASIWPREGEFGDESIFEVNHLPGEYGPKGWGAAWQGYGTNLPTFISPNDLKGHDVYKGGWGFAPVRTETYAIFENDDVRRDASINAFEEGSYVPRFQDTGLFMAKYAARTGYNPPPGDQDLNYENNLRIFRLAETYLNIAELIAVHGVAQGDGISAQAALDAIRLRAGVASIAPTAENIKLERRREFVGEGMRFWDLVRWGDGDQLTENLSDYSSVRTWTPVKKYLPIPQSEIDRTEGEFKLEQNPG